MRYGKTQAHEDLDKINARLAKLGHNCNFRMSGRYGYQGLDLYGIMDGETTCLRTIATGTPRECINAAEFYAGEVAYATAIKLLEHKQ